MTWILAWNQLNFEVCYLFLAQFWQILAISSLKLPKNFKFFKNWARNELYSSKESWDHLKIDFMAKKYDLFEKKRKKWISWFFGWKLGGFDIFRGQFLKIFKKNPKNLTSPVNIKCFNLKNHHQLKKKILSTKKWRQIYSSSGPTGPPPGTQRVNTESERYFPFWDDHFEKKIQICQFFVNFYRFCFFNLRIS